MSEFLYVNDKLHLKYKNLFSSKYFSKAVFVSNKWDINKNLNLFSLHLLKYFI